MGYSIRMNSHYAIRDFQLPDGTIPFAVWLQSLRSAEAKARIRRRLKRVAEGNFGDHKSVGNGVWELRIDFGTGYRVYYAIYGMTLVLLLCGGDKTSQQQDIATAILYKDMYEEANGVQK